MTNTDHILIFIITFVENAEYYVGVLCVTTVKLNPFVTVEVVQFWQVLWFTDSNYIDI